MEQNPDEFFEKYIKGGIQINARKNILNAMNKFGIEATEEKIKEYYKKYPKLLKIMLDEYRNIINGNLSE
jgi:hypothetical protein